MEKFKFGRSSKKNMKGIDERLIQLLERSLIRSHIDFGVPQYGGLRTAQDQNNLYHRRPRVTWIDGFKKKSYHQTGKAFDIFCLKDGKADWSDISQYKEVAECIFQEFEAMKEEGIFKEDEYLHHGGKWVRWQDWPHFELRNKPQKVKVNNPEHDK